MKSKKYNYVYKITNLRPTDERKYYIGIRSCDCYPEKDDYWSSCKTLHKHIRSYKIPSFKKEILFVYDTREEALTKEIELHEEHSVSANPEFYNQAKQTSTGFDPNDNPEVRKKMRERVIQYWKDHPEEKEYRRQKYSGEGNPFYGKKHSEESLKKIGEKSKGRIPGEETRCKMSEAHSGKNNHWYGKTLPEEYRQKISENHIDVSGSQNPAARTYILTSPDGDIFTITGGINKFCKEHNLSYGKKMRDYIGKGPIPDGVNQGWSVERR